mgnify:CR=1 FL=1
MKLVEFNYTKQDGSVSDRAVVMLQEPQRNYAGIDVSQLDESSFASFLDDYRIMKNRQHEEMMQLMAQHDLKHNYRQFVPDRMQITETSWV